MSSVSELFLYPKGDHGFGMHNKSTTDEWTDYLKKWLKVNRWL
ncbi:hypothetical protein [Flavobacterium sp. 3HN19-14]